MMIIEVHAEKNYAWCEHGGTFIYGRDEADVNNAIDCLIEHGDRYDTTRS